MEAFTQIYKWVEARKRKIIVYVLSILMSSATIFTIVQNAQYKLIPYSTFVEHLNRRTIESVIIYSDSSLRLALSTGQLYRTIIPVEFVKMSQLWDNLVLANVKITKSAYEAWMRFIIKTSVALSTIAYMGYMLYYIHSTFKGEESGAIQLDNNQYQVKASFNDVAGVGPAKQELINIVEMLKSSSAPLGNGDDMPVPRGILLYGPSGTGKTLLAKCLAGECEMSFLACSGSDFIDTYAGRGASRIRDLFARARQQSPAIIFIDEIDSLAGKRDSNYGVHEEREQTLNQLLYEMDSIKSELHASSIDRKNTVVIVIAATNRVKMLDQAILRSGRFDYHIEVPLPSVDERLHILCIHASKYTLHDDVCLDKLAATLHNHTGADIKLLVDETVRIAYRRNFRKPTELRLGDFQTAFKKLSQQVRLRPSY